MEKEPPTNSPSLTLIGGKPQTDESDEQMDEKTSDLLTTKVCSVVSETLERLLAPSETCSVFTKTLERLLAPAAELEFIKRKALLTEQEVAIYFSVPAKTLRNDRSRASGPRYIKKGSRILYSMVDLMNYYNGHRIRTNENL